MLVSGIQQSDSVIYICVIYTYICILFQILFHYDLSQNIEYISLCYTVGPCPYIFQILIIFPFYYCQYFLAFYSLSFHSHFDIFLIGKDVNFNEIKFIHLWFAFFMSF